MLLERVNIKNIKAEIGKTFYEVIYNNYSELIKNVAICKMNGRYHELNETIEEDGEIKVIGFDNEFGIKIYSRTLQFIFIKAALEIFPDSKITIEQSISKAIYGEIHKRSILTEAEVLKIKKRMQEIIDRDMPIEREKVNKERAIKIFSKYNMEDKIKLIENCDMNEFKLCKLEDRYDYFYECMAYSTGVIKLFDLQKYEDGFILRRPSSNDMNTLAEFIEQKSLSKVFLETERWLRILDVY